MKLLAKLWVFCVVVMLSGPFAMAQDCQEFTNHFIGKKVMAKSDLPTVPGGIGVTYDRAFTPDVSQIPPLPELLAWYGIGVSAGEVAQIMELKCAEKRIKLYLNGRGTDAGYANAKLQNENGPFGPRKIQGGSLVSLLFQDNLESLRDKLTPAFVETLFSPFLEFDSARFERDKANWLKKNQALRGETLQALPKLQAQFAEAKRKKAMAKSGEVRVVDKGGFISRSDVQGLRVAPGNALAGWKDLNLAAGADEVATRFGKPKQTAEADSGWGPRFKHFWYESKDEFGSRTVVRLTFVDASNDSLSGRSNPTPLLRHYRLIGAVFVGQLGR